MTEQDIPDTNTSNSEEIQDEYSEVEENPLEIGRSVKIRNVKPEDLAELNRIITSSVIDSETGETIPEEVEEILTAIQESIDGKNDWTYIVAEEDGKAVGVMGMRPPTEEMIPFSTTAEPKTQTKELINAFINPNQRGNGTGRALAQELEERAKVEGCTEIVVNSGPRYKESGWPFWTRLYGEPIAIAKDFYGNGLDAPVWRKPI